MAEWIPTTGWAGLRRMQKRKQLKGWIEEWNGQISNLDLLKAKILSQIQEDLDRRGIYQVSVALKHMRQEHKGHVSTKSRKKKSNGRKDSSTNGWKWKIELFHGIHVLFHGHLWWVCGLHTLESAISIGSVMKKGGEKTTFYMEKFTSPISPFLSHTSKSSRSQITSEVFHGNFGGLLLEEGEREISGGPYLRERRRRRGG